ncbi:nucleotidyl transferase AbiEii/AbiGii toxin family protein [Candidatus Roizmanbacteria bacterium]|nr:nucleotidyl transferase AbiEii/AbiGii toxin family protein [Candidatus Roizmanbacteria bacterium]
MSLPYLDRLSPERRQAFNKLKVFSNYVLAGGTAIMFQMGDRMSYDFDCFSEKNIPKSLLTKVKKIFGVNVLVQIETSDMILIKTKEGVDISFVFHPYKPLYKPIQTNSIPTFVLDDLAANKAFTIGRRGVWRDYIDIFFFLKRNKYSIKDLIRLAERKFSGEFSEKLFLGQLTYFDDIKIVPTVFLKEKYSDEEIKNYLQSQVKDYLRGVFA